MELEIREMITADIIEALKHDNIDAAIVASGTCGDGIVEHDLFSDRFYAYVSPENPLFERTNIRIEDIDLKDLILLSRGNCMRDQIIELCQARRSVPSHYYFESGSLDTLMRIVDCTACLTIIPEMALEYIPAERRAQVKTLAKGATSRRIAIVVRRTYVKNSIISALESTIMAKAAPRLPPKVPSLPRRSRKRHDRHRITAKNDTNRCAAGRRSRAAVRFFATTLRTDALISTTGRHTLSCTPNSA